MILSSNEQTFCLVAMTVVACIIVWATKDDKTKRDIKLNTKIKVKNGIKRLKHTAQSHKIMTILAVSLIGFCLKLLYYDGVATCKPVKYRGTVMGIVLGYEPRKNVSRQKQLEEVIPTGMPAEELLVMLKEQGIKPHIGTQYYDVPDPRPSVSNMLKNNFYKINIDPPDYIISFSDKFLCVYGEHIPLLSIWIKDDKIYKKRFRVDRSFI